MQSSRPRSPAQLRAISLLGALAAIILMFMPSAVTATDKDKPPAGWKAWEALRASKSAQLGDMVITVQRPRRSRRWIHDRHGSRYRYQVARKGHEYLILDLKIASPSDNPRLPPLVLYRFATNGYLVREEVLGLRFYRWTNFGAYLGTGHDFRNDFAHAEAVRFTSSTQLKKGRWAAESFVIVAMNEPCLERKTDRWEQPPVWYAGTCSLPLMIKAEDLPKHGVAVYKHAGRDLRKLRARRR